MNHTKIAALFAAASLAVGCAHAKTVDRGGDNEKASDEKTAKAKADPNKPPRAQGRSTPATKPGHPPVAATPEGLFKPGAAEKIQAALERRGQLQKGHRSSSLDADTVAALKKFQGAEKIAQTGAPDHETVERLGLDAADVYVVNPTGEKRANEEAKKRGE
jgi:hypothetical protein